VGGTIGVFVTNCICMATALFVLYHEPWFQCRSADSDGILAGSTLLMSDNYETTVVFLMVVIQMISASIFFSFGHEYRQAWYRNITFVVLAVAYSFLHIYVTLVPGLVSCLFRINCDNDHVVRGLWTSVLIPTGIFRIRFMHLLKLR
jgi:magnesium-transporting ATPase (P-type)